MNNTEHKGEFNPSGVGMRNGNFMGLPFSEETAKMILLPVPWDVTVSYGGGTAFGPHAILGASVQIDLSDYNFSEPWKLGIYMKKVDESILFRRNKLRPKAESYIRFLENGGSIRKNSSKKRELEEINSQCGKINDWVYLRSKEILDSGKLSGLLGGDHSVPLGFLKALGEKYNSFGILQIDAHLDLRSNYEGFLFSHASIFKNALKYPSITKLVQVGIRDYCEEELVKVKQEGSRISVFFDDVLKERHFKGMVWNDQCEEIVEQLPEFVYISLDVDGFDSKLCPCTGTPVPGGLDFHEVVFLFNKLVESRRKIIGFDVCETGNGEWDGNVAARITYKLCTLTARSHGLI